MKSAPVYILPVIIFAQFTGTSLWFAGNAVLPDLITEFNFKANDLGTITSVVQFGFIVGTLVFAIFTVADKFSPSKVFFWCSLLASALNGLIVLVPMSLLSISILRFMVGFMLAGIYPVGMKLAADWFPTRLSKAIGLLVGALVLGTAFPHLIRSLGTSFQWFEVMISVSILAAFGGILIYLLVPDGPYRKRSSGFQPKAILVLFRSKGLRSSAFGYFGHMWELYTVWAFIPVIITYYNTHHSVQFNVSLISFISIAAGFLGCSIGGLVGLRKGSAQVAFVQLSGSALCIFLTVFVDYMAPWIFIGYLFLWGVLVVGDSPQFSVLAAKTAPPEWIGSALTIMNSIGFALTIPSIYLANYLIVQFGTPAVLIFLLAGPIFGLIYTKRLFYLAPKATGG